MPNPCELPRHMYYLSYSADGEQAHPPAGMYPSAPCTPEPDGPRAAVLPERDPLANSSQLVSSLGMYTTVLYSLLASVNCCSMTR